MPLGGDTKGWWETAPVDLYLEFRIPICGPTCGGGGRVWHLADSMQDTAFRITESDVDWVLADRTRFFAVVVWSLREPRASHRQYEIARASEN